VFSHLTEVIDVDAFRAIGELVETATTTLGGLLRKTELDRAGEARQAVYLTSPGQDLDRVGN
jgi:hypothetical protein